MTRSLTNSIHIDAPVGEVFAYVRDPSHFNLLMPDVTFSDVALTPDGVGTSYRFETRVAGLPIRGRGEYPEFTPDRHIHDDTSVASEGSFDWTFEAEGDGVRVTITHLPGRYWGLPIIGRLLAHNYEQMDQQILVRLKSMLEGQRLS
jgi:uncharacterized protein YndB with AHSA1/START domain